MSERKVLNKYYPPDFDPSKIPRMKLARNRQYTVRLMAPFNMRCKTCGEYIYKGKKFNARKEDVEGDDYLGIRIYRFYIKCTRCLQEISFKTDPKNTDYEIEAGATRNFMALKLAEEQAQREEDEEKEEEATNPMKLLEKRTQQSKQELELLESLEELKDLNRRQQTIDYDRMLEQYDDQAAARRTIKEQEDIDEEFVKSIFKKKNGAGTVVEEEIIELGDDEASEPRRKVRKIAEATQISSSDGSAAPVGGSNAERATKPTASGSGLSTRTETGAAKSSRVAMNNLVKKKIVIGVKTSTNVGGKPNGDRNETTSGEKGETTIGNAESGESKPQGFGLALVGAYSGSSDDDND